MKLKRLDLNWDLAFKDERALFAQNYINRVPFELTSDELEMVGKYILWGKSRDTGLNGRQEGLELETAHKTWDAQDVESLDALLESPTFSESLLRSPSSNSPIYKTPKEVFDRADARKKAPAALKADFEALWKQIDETELQVNFYEVAHGKRKNPPRDSLLNRFTPSEQDVLRGRAASLNAFNYLKLRHLLVELRRQQFTLKDSYSSELMRRPTFQEVESTSIFYGEDINIRPLGLKFKNSSLLSKMLRPDRFPMPADFSARDLEEVSTLLWAPLVSGIPTFDFSNSTDLAKLDGVYNELKEFCKSEDYDPLQSNLDELLYTYDVYCALTPLKDFQRDILILKRKGLSNEKVAAAINAKYNHKYTINYISTLYHKSILGSIAATAKKHREVCENLFFPENFKTCIDCGQTLLRDNDNFMHKAKVKDGFDCRCKSCAKKLRDKRSKK